MTRYLKVIKSSMRMVYGMSDYKKLHTNRVKTSKSSKDQLLNIMRRYNKSKDIEFFMSGFIWFTNVMYNDGYEELVSRYISSDDHGGLEFTMSENEIIGKENPASLALVINRFAKLKGDNLNRADFTPIIKVRNIIAHSNNACDDLLKLKPSQVISKDSLKNIITAIFGDDSKVCFEFLYIFQNELKRIQDKKSNTDPIFLLFEEIKR